MTIIIVPCLHLCKDRKCPMNRVWHLSEKWGYCIVKNGCIKTHNADLTNIGDKKE